MSLLPKNVLIVDDDNVRSHKISAMVNKFGYNVFVAATEPDFHRIVNGIIPQAVIINIHMPKISGKTYMSILKSLPVLSMIKVLVFGDKKDETELKAAVVKGANAFIVWPSDVTELYAALQKMLESTPRRVPRLRVLVRAALLTENSKASYFATCISEYGVFIHTNNMLPVGTRLRVMLDLPGPHPFEVAGHVIYTVKHEPDKFIEPGIGIAFDTTKKVQEGLREFIESVFLAEHDTGLLV